MTYLSFGKAATNDNNVIVTAPTTTTDPPDENVISNISPLAAVLPAQPSMSLSPLPCDPPQSPSWKSAHEAYCVKQNVLRATIQQVLQDVGRENEHIPWALPQRGTVLVEAREVALLLRASKEAISTTATTTTVNSGVKTSWLSYPVTLTKKLAYTVWTTTMGSDDYYSDEEWIQEGDDAFMDDDSNDYDTEVSSSVAADKGAGGRLDVSTPLIHLDRTRVAIQRLEEEINLHATPAFHGGVEPIIVGWSEWSRWALTAIAKRTDVSSASLSQLSLPDIEFLLQVLLCLNVAQIIRRKEKSGLSDLIVLLPHSMLPKDSTKVNDERELDDNAIPVSLQVPIALWDIRNAEQLIEQQIQNWSEHVSQCNEKALRYKRQNQKKLALGLMSKRKVIQQNIDMSTQKLVQLEQTKAAIESARSNKMMVDLLAGSTKLLRDLRKETPMEQVDLVHDEFLSELDDLQEFHDAIVATNMATLGGSVDDDELLKELQSLSLEDLDGTSNPPVSEHENIHDDNNVDFVKQVVPIVASSPATMTAEKCETGGVSHDPTNTTADNDKDHASEKNPEAAS